MMKKLFLFITLLFFTCLSFAQTRNLKLVKAPIENPTNEKRKAVVIGMSDYGAGRILNNTLKDADDMADVFTRLGFQVTLLKNNDLRSLRTNLTDWYNTIEGNDMAIFYFAGHGMEVNGENFLIPIDAELNSQTDVEYNTLNVNQVLGNMDEKRVGMKLLILDACRDNPFKRSWSRGSEEKGLAQMRAPRGTFIAFAAAPGETAADGGNYNLSNGVFSYYLKQEIVKDGVSIDHIFTNVSREVSTLTNDRQAPFRNSSLTEIFYFIPPGNNGPIQPPVVINTPKADVGSPTNSKTSNISIETPCKRLELQLISTELISNGKELLLEFLLTNRGEDINCYELYGGHTCTNMSMAYDNLGNKMAITIIWNGMNSRDWSCQAHGPILGNMPTSMKVIVFNINSRATHIMQIRIYGQCCGPNQSSCMGCGGNFIVKNVPIQ